MKSSLVNLRRIRPLAVSVVISATFILGLASIPPARAAIEAVMSCAKSTPCLSWDNTQAGNAIKGVSTKGVALHGQTKYNSSGKSAGKAGVIGEDASTSGTLNSGITGYSVNGAGVSGTSTSSNAVQGFSSNSTGAYGQTGAPGGFGFAGRNSATGSGQGAGLLGDGGTSNVGVFGRAAAGNGVYAYSATGTSMHLFQGGGNVHDELWIQGNIDGSDAIRTTDVLAHTIFSVSSAGDLTATSDSNTNFIENVSGNSAHPALSLVGGGVNTRFEVFGVYDADFNEAAAVSDIGTFGISGLFYSIGQCNHGCLVGKQRAHGVAEYVPVESEPTIEEFGQGTLVGGAADIALDPKFTNVIDARKRYFVLLVPDGDCHGLYLARETSRGFTVRELEGGKSSVTFEYRIVAKRFGVDAPRLAMSPIKSMRGRAVGNRVSALRR